jgi:hypothetical protein
MKHLKTAILILTGVIVAIAVVCSFPNWWKSKIETYLNQELFQPNGWTIKVDSLSGNFLTSVMVWNVEIKGSDDRRISAPILRVNPSITSFLAGKIGFGILSAEGIHIVTSPPQTDSTSIDLNRSVQDLLKNQVRITDLHLDGIIAMLVDDSLKETRFSFDGGLNIKSQDARLNLKSFVLQLPDSPFELNLQSIEGRLNPDSLVFSFDHSRINHQDLVGTIRYCWVPESRIVADIALKDFQLPEELFAQLPLKPQFSRFNLQVQFQSDLRQFSGTTRVDNNLGLHMEGDFYASGLPEYLHLNNLTLKGNDAELEVGGILEKSGRFSGKVTLSNLDLGRWLENQKTSNVSGYLVVEGQTRRFAIHSLQVSGEVDESQLFGEERASISGSILYTDQQVKTLTPLMLTVGSSSIRIEGHEMFTTDSLEISLELQDANTFLFSKLIGDTLSSGRATGTMQLAGIPGNLNANVNLVIQDFEYKDAHLDYFELNGLLGNLPDLTRGDVDAKFGKGSWREYGFDGGTGEFLIKGDTIAISGLELKQGKNFFQFSGSLEQKKVLQIDRLQVAYNNHYLINPAPLSIERTEDGFSIRPFELHVDDGVVEGFYNPTPPAAGRLKFSNLPTDLIYLADITDKFHISGMAFGEFGLKQLGDSPDVTIDLSIKNGEILQQHFDDFYFSAFYRQGVLHIDEFTLTEGTKTGLQLTGKFPIKERPDRRGKVDLQSDFKNLDLAFLDQLIPNWFQIGGSMTGNFSMKGTRARTLYQFKGKIAEARFESIPLGTVTGEGYYDGRNLNFNHVESVRGPNTIHAAGSLPLDFNLASDRFGKYKTNGNEFDFMVQGDLTDFIFLTNYLTDVDSIRGDIVLQLKLEGPPDHIVRNGQLSITNGRIYTVLMDAPVVDVSAEAVIEKNLFTVESFSGALVNRQKKKKLKPNLFLTGTMDLSRFFEPRYDLKLTGKRVYYRSLSGDIEGLADVDLQVVGKDTIDITGVIAALDGAYYRDFNAQESIESSETSGRVVTNYNLRFPIKERFAIRNAQIDTEIGGELDMTKIGDRDWDYSGEIHFLDGKIYYYLGGDVFENLKGNMTFDGNGFNPFLDLSAMTKIGDTEIRLGVYGPLNNPEWVFDSNQGLSESDILQLLTFHTRISEEGITSQGLGTQAQSVLGAYLERQFEKNFIRLSGLESTGLVKEVSISGTSDLIRKQGREDFTISAKVTDRFSFNYRRSFSLDNPYQNRVGVEYKLNPYFSMVGNVDESGQMHMKLRLRYSY